MRGDMKMPVSMNTYNVAYKSRVYKAVAIVNMIFPEEGEEPYNITVLVIDENGNIKHITDKTKMFQFIPVIH